MRICVFDTETTSLDKPFCYNIGFIIYDTELQTIACAKEYCIEQIWHNKALFCSAYYADKRPFYVKEMRARNIALNKWGYVMQEMIRIFKNFEVAAAYAYNSSFDEKVFEFNCDWFKTANPFDTIPIFDIRGYVHQFIAFTPEYQKFCEENERFTESGNYSTTAESVFQYITFSKDFTEQHTALADSEIELEILLHCIANGAKWETGYKTYSSIPRRIIKTLSIYDKNSKNEVFCRDYTKIRINKEKTKITLE